MKTMIIDQIIEKLKNCSLPKLGDEIIICDNYPNIRLGVDRNAAPYLFFKSTLTARRFGTFHKVGFTAEFYQKLDLYDEDGNVFSDSFDYLKFTGKTTDENQFVLKIMAILLEELSFEYSSELLRSGLERISHLLKNRTKKTNTSIQGLIGELLFIYDSSDLVESFLGWRTNEYQKLDFQIGERVFEIKTSRGNRIIMLEYNQVYNLNPIENICLVSYLINEEGHDNIITLMQLIYEKLPLQYKSQFEEKFYTELGEKINEIDDNTFHLEMTKSSKFVLPAKSLPITRIVDMHRSISNIKYSIDLDKL